MKDALDLKSKSGIHRLITALVERGFIRRLPHRARAIEVTACPNPAVAYKTPNPIPFASAPNWKLCSKTSATVSPDSPGIKVHKGHVATTTLGCPAERSLAGSVL